MERINESHNFYPILKEKAQEILMGLDGMTVWEVKAILAEVVTIMNYNSVLKYNVSMPKTINW